MVFNEKVRLNQERNKDFDLHINYPVSLNERQINKAFTFDLSLKNHNGYITERKANKNLELGKLDVVANFEAHVSESVRAVLAKEITNLKFTNL